MAHNLSPDRFCINTATFGFQSPIEETIEAVAKAGFEHITIWRREVDGKDLKHVARRIKDAGLSLSGYCRSDYIPSDDLSEYRCNIESNKRLLDDAATLDAKLFAMVLGSHKNLAMARTQVHDACAELSAHGESVGVKIGVEPLHPAYAADRSCINTIAQAVDMCEAINSTHIGLVLDCYHIWWDPKLSDSIARARNKILSFHVSDWLNPTTDILNDRGMMGDGVIDIKSIRQQVDSTGYNGVVEVELFSVNNWWKRPIAETLSICHERMKEL